MRAGASAWGMEPQEPNPDRVRVFGEYPPAETRENDYARSEARDVAATQRFRTWLATTIERLLETGYSSAASP